ncbi:AMP-dependent synthetase/ligase [Macrophomina phaseolina MS6]|uniref:AMP-dependent synthetase/ligase n=1 Tax=Macrophomina phaseolina (strain MS6) TaxID=1126212 RepID=K2RA65_MACPH|nr:AMP-dependent synthetase/ligase [Macrophomina phaseolina MS6]
MPHAEGHARFDPEEEGGKICRLVVGPGLPTRGWGEEQARPDGWFDTKDLFERHPVDEGKWRFVGRQDDTIVLVNGEKANAVPFELAVKRNKHVKTAVAFGNQRDSMGIIIIPERTALTSEQMLESVWPEVEAVNQQVPKYAKISRDALLIKDPGTPFPSTDKGTVIRSAFYKQFEADIESHYTGMRLPNGSENNETESGNTEPSLRNAIRKAVKETLQVKTSKMADDTDFYTLDMDSLQATRIQAKLAKQTSRVIPMNAISQNPSVDLLVKYLKSQQKISRPAEEVAAKLIEKYSSFPSRKGTGIPRVGGKEIVVSSPLGLPQPIVH